MKQLSGSTIIELVVAMALLLMLMAWVSVVGFNISAVSLVENKPKVISEIKTDWLNLQESAGLVDHQWEIDNVSYDRSIMYDRELELYSVVYTATIGENVLCEMKYWRYDE